MLGRRVPLLLYADDIVLLARTEAELQAMLDVVTVYARQWRFQLNHKKSNVVVVVLHKSIRAPSVGREGR